LTLPHCAEIRSHRIADEPAITRVGERLIDSPVESAANADDLTQTIS
jgi:hypothetical protein